MPEDKDEAWRYRNKLTVLFPFKFTDLEVQPYIADEVFIDFHGAKFNRNRLYAGLKFKVIKNLKADVFYLWQTSKKKSKRIDYNVIGLKLKLVF